MRGVLSRFTSGRFFKKTFSVLLKILSVLSVLLGVYLWVRAWGPISDLGVGGVLGGLIFQFIALVVIYMVAHTLFIRADEISSLPESGYAVIPIGAVFFRLLGDLYACIQIPFAIAGGIMIWFGGRGAGYFLQSVLPEPLFRLTGTSGFWAGLLIMIVGAVLSFLVLLVFYFLSESIRVTVDIAVNTDQTAQHLEEE